MDFLAIPVKMTPGPKGLVLLLFYLPASLVWWQQLSLGWRTTCKIWNTGLIATTPLGCFRDCPESWMNMSKQGYVSLSHAVSLAKNKLAACANSWSSSGPVLLAFCDMKSNKICFLVDFVPLSHSCSKFITLEIAVCCLAEPIVTSIVFDLNYLTNVTK